MVTINYRVGAIGFLAFGEGDNAPRGNYGLKVGMHAIASANTYMVSRLLFIECHINSSIGSEIGSGVGQGKHCQLWGQSRHGYIVGSKCRRCLCGTTYGECKECRPVQ